MSIKNWYVPEGKGGRCVGRTILPPSCAAECLEIWEAQTVHPCTKIALPCFYINPLTPNDHYRGRTAPLTSKRCILYIYSTNIGTEYFKHGIYSPFFFPSNAVCFIILMYLVPVLFTFYIQGVLKLKKK